MSTFEKNLIVNGSLNPSLSLQEIESHFSEQDWCRVASTIAAYLNFLDKSVDIPKHSEILEKPGFYLNMLWHLRELFHNDQRVALSKEHTLEGQDLYTAISKISSPRSHTLQLFPYQAYGYVGCLSDLNNFKVPSVQRVILEVERLGILSDFGINNTNTGKEVVSWEIQGDYVVLCINCMSLKTKVNVLKDHDSMIKTLMTSANPDVIRVEGSEDGSRQLRYVMRWD